MNVMTFLITANGAGRLPAELKRGMLSENGVWNLLSNARKLNKRINNIE